MTAAPAQTHERRQVRPVTRPSRMGHSVYEALLKLVAAGRLRPGQHLAEPELARQLGVSRQPVHEALHRLRAEGWVELIPGRGAFVHAPAGHEVDDLLDVRELLEAEMARLAAEKVTPGQVTRLRKACSAGETATVAADTERFVTANNDFHATLAEIAGNPTLAELADFVSRRARWCYRMVAPSRGQESCAEHLELVDAIEDGDRERAAKLAHAHIERTRAVFGSSPGR